MDQNGILFFYPGALYVAGTRMQIHGLPQFPAMIPHLLEEPRWKYMACLKPVQMIPHSQLKPVTGIIAPAVAQERGAAYNSA